MKVTLIQYLADNPELKPELKNFVVDGRSSGKIILQDTTDYALVFTTIFNDPDIIKKHIYGILINKYDTISEIYYLGLFNYERNMRNRHAVLAQKANALLNLLADIKFIDAMPLNNEPFEQLPK